MTRRLFINMMKIINLKQLRGYKTCVGSAKIAVRKNTGKGFLDYENRSGILTKQLRREGIDLTDVDIFQYYEIVDNPYYQIEREKPVECKICHEHFLSNRDGKLTRHLRDVHKLSVEEYLDSFPEESKVFPLRSKKVEKEKFFSACPENSITCPMCGKVLGRITQTHVKKEHGLTLDEFRKETGLVTLMSNYLCRFFRENVDEHRLSKGLSIKSSEPEKRVRKLLQGQPVRLEGREFDIKVDNILVEIDGEYWHPDSVKSINPTQVRNLVNDYFKEQLAKKYNMELIRVHVKDLPERDEDITLEKLRELNYRPSYNLKFNDDIVSSSVLLHCIERYGRESVEKIYLDDFVDMIYLCQPTFPVIPQIEDLSAVIIKLGKSNDSYYEKHGCFTFNGSNVGNNILKSRFRSFWNSSNKGALSPVEVWTNRDLMRDIIKYRVGLNDKKECYGLGLKWIVRGINVNRFCVSFFKPSLASSIYRHYLGDVETPVVFDPCCGFGARLLAFKSTYPNGTYIGCEPNVETFKELQSLVKEAGFSQVFLHNCKLEDLKDIPEYDLGFTSPPYFDMEDYKNGVSYENFEDWKLKFWDKLVNLPNMYININNKLYSQLSSEIKIIDRIKKSINPVGNSSQVQEEFIVKKS